MTPAWHLLNEALAQYSLKLSDFSIW